MRGHSEEESHVIEPRPEVQGLPIYRPGRPGHVSAEAVQNLAANENAWGPSPAAVEAWRRWDGGATYPDMGGQILKEALEAQWSVPSSAMLLGTGSGHLIKCLAETYLRPNDRVAAVHPTFSLYAQGASLMGAQVAALPGTGHQVRWAPSHGIFGSSIAFLDASSLGGVLAELVEVGAPA
jgi:histidinol-phosphate aminotransferase